MGRGGCRGRNDGNTTTLSRVLTIWILLIAPSFFRSYFGNKVKHQGEKWHCKWNFCYTRVPVERRKQETALCSSKLRQESCC